MAAAVAIPAGPPAYGPPAPYHEEKLAPQPFAYEYGVADDYSKANFKKAESQEAEGNVAGSFTIALPDGRIQTTTYTADHVNGFVAEVTYQGTPVYPEAPKGGYGPHPAAARSAEGCRQQMAKLIAARWLRSRIERPTSLARTDRRKTIANSF